MATEPSPSDCGLIFAPGFGLAALRIATRQFRATSDVDPVRVNLRRKASIGFLAATGLALAGCASAPQNYDLHAAAARAHAARGTISVDLPTAATPLDGTFIVVRDGDDRLSSLAGAQWVDRLTALVQSRTVQTFQNAGLLGKLRASGEPANYRLSLAIQRFDIDAPQRLARVEIAAQLVSDGGKVRAAKIFSASEPVAQISGAYPPVALDDALGQVLPQIVTWAAAAS